MNHHVECQFYNGFYFSCRQFFFQRKNSVRISTSTSQHVFRYSNVPAQISHIDGNKIAISSRLHGQKKNGKYPLSSFRRSPIHFIQLKPRSACFSKKTVRYATVSNRKTRRTSCEVLKRKKVSRKFCVCVCFFFCHYTGSGESSDGKTRGEKK